MKKRMIIQKPSMFIYRGISPVEIYDTTGEIFYIVKPKKGKAVFNLPKGTYNLKEFTRFEIKKGKLFQYPMIPLPKKDRNLKRPKKFKLKFGSNPNKATVNLIEGTIFFDQDFYNSLNRTQKEFILAHELGHYFYKGGSQKNEQKCDAFACNLLLTKGFNPSQIDAAQKSTLDGHKSNVRISTTLNDLQNVSKNRH